MSAKTHEDIPGEMWLDVFGRCLGPSPRDIQLCYLSQVCKRWNKLVTEAPELWDHVVLSGDRDFNDDAKIRMYVSRSKQMPLSIELHGSGVDSEKISRVANIVGGEASRIRAIEIAHDDILTLSQALDIIGLHENGSTPRRFEELQDLRIRWTRVFPSLPAWDEDFPGDEDFTCEPAIFSKSENLTNLAIPLGFIFIREAVFWEKLTSLEISDEPGQEIGENFEILHSVLNILEACVSLEHFAFHCTRRLGIQLVHSPTTSARHLEVRIRTVQMPYLRSIDLVVPSIGLDVLGAIRAPGLQTLKLKDDRGGRMRSWTLYDSNSLFTLLRRWIHTCNGLDVASFHGFMDAGFVRKLQRVFWDIEVSRVTFVDCFLPISYPYDNTLDMPASRTGQMTLELHRCEHDLKYVRHLADLLQERALELPELVINDKTYTLEELETMWNSDEEGGPAPHTPPLQTGSRPVLGSPFQLDDDLIGAPYLWKDLKASDNSPPWTISDLPDSPIPSPSISAFQFSASDGIPEVQPEGDERPIMTASPVEDEDRHDTASLTDEIVVIPMKRKARSSDA